MKAAICYEFGKPLVVEEVDIDPVNEKTLLKLSLSSQMMDSVMLRIYVGSLV